MRTPAILLLLPDICLPLAVDHWGCIYIYIYLYVYTYNILVFREGNLWLYIGLLLGILDSCFERTVLLIRWVIHIIGRLDGC